MKNRRLGPDTIMNILSGISIVSWVILGVIFIMLAVGNPSAMREVKRGGQWTTSAIYGLLVLLVILSGSGILFNMLRMKRKSDKMRISLIFSGILSILGLIIMNIK